MKQVWQRFKQHSIRNLILFLLVAFVGWIALRGTLNYSGYCWAQKRFIPEDEMIRTAIQEIEKKDSIKIEIPNREKHESTDVSYKYLKYKSVDEFLEKNPNCCSVQYIRNQYPDGFLNRVLGMYWGSVTLTYKAKYMDENGVQHQKDEYNTIELSNCSQPFQY